MKIETKRHGGISLGGETTYYPREKNTLDLLLTSLPGQFQDIHSPGKLNDHDIVAGTLKVVTL